MWAINEFEKISLGDQRLNNRLTKLADKFAKPPESSINKACDSWAETKAAYRFFQNQNVCKFKVLAGHIEKTIERASQYKSILAIQDTCYISYKNHEKTKGLGIIASRIRSETTNFKTPGLVMHTTFAITTEGLPLGLLDQQIYSRPEIPEAIKQLKQRSHNMAVPIEEKESMKWIESFKRSNNLPGLKNVQVITVCDREADIYDLFNVACSSQSSFLIRARQDRTVNKRSLNCKKSGEKLWKVIQNWDCQGVIEIEVPAKDNKPRRTASLEVRFGSYD